MIMQIQLQLLFILKGFFSITISQEKEENKDIIWEAKTNFINDLKSHSKQISPTTLILPPWAEGKFFKRKKQINKTNYFETCMQEGT